MLPNSVDMANNSIPIIKDYNIQRNILQTLKDSHKMSRIFSDLNKY